MAIILNNLTLTAQNLPGTVVVQNPNGGFGIDGDAYANFPTVGIGDWFYNPSYPGSGGSLFNSDGTVIDATRTFFLQDDWGSADRTTFFTSSKIDDDPNSYLWSSSNNLLAKDDMQNVGAHFAFTGPNQTGDLWCIFAADRQQVNGDAYIDFEFLQKPLTINGLTNGGFESEGTDGGRTVGDILVTLIFTKGGTAAIVEIRVWEPVTKGFEYVLHPDSEFSGSIFVTNNLTITNVPFDVYGTTPGVYEPNQWAEGAINLSELLNFGENPCAKISTLFVRTKTSQSPSAELKDFPGIIQLNLELNDLTVNCPANVIMPACSTQEQINIAFDTWKAGFSYKGGVAPITQSYAYTGGGPVDMGALSPPSICGGAISITYTATDFCEQTASCIGTFTVTAPPAVVVVPAVDKTTAACSYADQTAANSAFATWLATASVSGGCAPTSIPDITTAPPYCGGDVIVTWTIADKCYTTSTYSATFSITAPPAVVVVPAVDKTTAACSYADQAAANSAFATWLTTASVSGGCGPTSIPDITTAPAYCGGDVKVTWTIADKCYTTSTYSATFSITAPPAVVVVPAVDKTTAACSYSDQAAANSAFATWLATASVSGGCGPTSIPDITTAPPYCGGDVKVTWRIADKCYDGMTYSATFTITVPEPLVISNVTDLIIPGCTYGTQEDLNAAFALWLEGFTVSGGCDPKGVFADNYTAPDSVTGGFVDVVYNVTDLCENGSDIARYTVGPCVNAHCTYTQGYYGNLGGISCADGKSYTTLALISKALSSPLYNGTMRIGLEGNSVLVSNTDADKNAILAVLPGGGSSYKLLTGNPQISALTGSFSSYLTKKGTLNNTLLAQTITLGLNLGIDGTLGGFGLQAGLDQYGKPIELATAAPQGGCGSNIPMPRSCSIGEGYGSVVNEYGYFQFPAFVNGMTVQELFTAANQALADGTLPMGVTMSTLANAVDMVNNAFDGCRIAIGYGVERLECKTSSAQEFVAFKVPIVNNQLTIKYKFSYVSDVTIDVFDAVTGAKVFSKLDTNSYLDKEVELDYNFNTGTERVYIVRLTTRLGHDEQKVMSDPY